MADAINSDGRMLPRRVDREFTSIGPVDPSGPQVDIKSLIDSTSVRIMVDGDFLTPEQMDANHRAAAAENDAAMRAYLNKSVAQNGQRLNNNVMKLIRDLSGNPNFSAGVQGSPLAWAGIDAVDNFLPLNSPLRASQQFAEILEIGPQLRPAEGFSTQQPVIKYLEKNGYLDVRANQMQTEVAKQLPAALVIASAPPTSVGYFVTGAGISAVASGTAQYITKGQIDTLDTLSAGLTGGLTFGKAFAPSVAVNSAGAYLTAEYKGEDARWKVAGAIVGTGLGGVIGGKLENQMLTRAIAATIEGNTRAATNYTFMSAPLNGLSSSSISEGVNYYFDKFPQISDKKK